ncbi:hypothetical protein GCM10009117_14180 [Gangjinia marincola]|uniref:Uncharacterized protein n=1 Tax=Gangjinia marincola TaxID=578463 RepID=A0ABN1MH29_9FLAO
MRFVVAKERLPLPTIETTLFFEQQVLSTKWINGQSTNQKAQRKFSVSYQPQPNGAIHVDITTKLYKVTLPSVLKKQEELILKISSLIDRLECVMDHQGRLSRLLNHREIMDHWAALKPKLMNQYKGSGVIGYIKGIEKKISNPSELLDDINQYRLFGFLFNGLYREYSSETSENPSNIKRIENAVFGLHYDVEERLELHQNKDDQMMVIISGQNANAPSQEKRFNTMMLNKNVYGGVELVLDTYHGNYLFSRSSGDVRNASLCMETSHGKNYKKKQEYEIRLLN